MALIRTDYGLIYNTNGNLCATLLPEGGVAVTEGTTNGIQNGNFATGDFTGWTDWNPANGQKSIVIRDGIKYAKIELVSAGENKSFGIQSTKNISVQPGDKVTVSFRLRGEKPNYTYLMLSVAPNISIAHLIQYTDLPNGESIGEYTWTADRAADVGFLFGYGGTPKSGEFTYAQLEKKAFRSPFVDGTRPAGILPYPELAKQFNQREFTFVAEWRPYTELGIGSSILDRYFQIDNGTITAGNRIRLSRINNSPGLMLELPNADGSGSQQYSFYPNSYPANAWHFIACVLDVPNMKTRIHLNDEYQEFPLTEVPAMLDLQRFFLGCVATSGQLNGELKNVQIINEALPVEVINNF